MRRWKTGTVALLTAALVGGSGAAMVASTAAAQETVKLEETLNHSGEFTGSLQLAGTRVPTLIIHAPDDREVSPDHAELYAAAGAHVRLHWTPGLGHRRILADRHVLEEALGFVSGTPLEVH